MKSLEKVRLSKEARYATLQKVKELLYNLRNNLMHFIRIETNFAKASYSTRASTMPIHTTGASFFYPFMR